MCILVCGNSIAVIGSTILANEKTMNWDDLRYILAVAREGTLLAGARVVAVAEEVERLMLRLDAEIVKVEWWIELCPGRS